MEGVLEVEARQVNQGQMKTASQVQKCTKECRTEVREERNLKRYLMVNSINSGWSQNVWV